MTADAQSTIEESPEPAGMPPVGDPVVSISQVLLAHRWAVLLDVALPIIGYQLLVSRGASDVVALSAIAIFPLAAALGSWGRERRVDALGGITLVFIAAGLVATFITGDPRLTLMKGSLLTGAFGLAFLASLLLPRPLAFYLGRHMMTGGKPEDVARWDALWQYRSFRHGNQVVSAVWGCSLLLEALLRIVLALSLTTAVFLVVWSVLSSGIYAGLLVWTVSYARR